MLTDLPPRKLRHRRHNPKLEPGGSDASVFPFPSPEFAPPFLWLRNEHHKSARLIASAGASYQQGYQLETDSLGGRRGARRARIDKGGDPLTIVWRLKKGKAR